MKDRKVFFHLLLFLGDKDLCWVSVAIGAVFRVRDSYVKDNGMSAPPEAVVACIAVFGCDLGEGLLMLLRLMLMVMLAGDRTRVVDGMS